MEKEFYISNEGLEKLKAELSEIDQVKLPDIAKKIAEAKDLGDLSENAEYHEAKQQQAFLFGKSQELKYKIKHAKIIEKGTGNGEVKIGSNIKVKCDGEVFDYEIVGSEESDPANGKISVDSPIGSALSGHKVGEEIVAQTPAGEIKYQIIEIV